MLSCSLLAFAYKFYCTVVWKDRRTVDPGVDMETSLSHCTPKSTAPGWRENFVVSVVAAAVYHNPTALRVILQVASLIYRRPYALTRVTKYRQWQWMQKHGGAVTSREARSNNEYAAPDVELMLTGSTLALTVSAVARRHRSVTNVFAVVVAFFCYCCFCLHFGGLW